MHNHTYRIQDVATIIQDKMGKTVQMGTDGQHRAKLVILNTEDLQSITVPANTVYFGDFIIEGFKNNSVSVEFRLETKTVFLMTSTHNPSGNTVSNVLWNSKNAFTDAYAHFCGWEITLNP